MHDSHKLLNLVNALKHLKGYFVIPVDDEELVVMRKEEFEKLKNNNKEVQLELQNTQSTDVNPDDLERANRELDIRHIDDATKNPEFEEDKDEQLEVGPRKKVRFEPLRGDLPPDLQE